MVEIQEVEWNMLPINECILLQDSIDEKRLTLTLRTVEGPIDEGIINNVTTLRVGNVQDPDDNTNFQTALRFANDNDSE